MKGRRNKTEFWDRQLSVMKILIGFHGFRAKQLAEFYQCSVGTILAMLHKRQTGLLLIRHQHKKQMGDL